MNVHDFNIHLDQHENGLAVHAEGRPLVGEATNRITADELKLLVKESEIFHDNTTRSRHKGAQAGQRIFNCVFRNRLLELLDEATEKADTEGGILRIVLKYDLNPSDISDSVHEVPWELLFNGKHGRFLALDERFLLVRHLRGNGRGFDPIEGPIRILATAACPQPYPRLKLAEELRLVTSVLARAPFAGLTRLRELAHLASDRLTKEFNYAHSSGEPFHIWHHCGHGGFDTDSAFELVLHSKQGDSESNKALVGRAELVELIAQHPELRVVILNVCLGGTKKGLASLAATLSVPAVIGYRSSVLDATALEFADALWRRLLIMPVDQAVRGARRILAGTVQPLDFARVLLFLRSLDRPVLLPATGSMWPIGLGQYD